MRRPAGGPLGVHEESSISLSGYVYLELGEKAARCYHSHDSREAELQRLNADDQSA